ncbi:MAG TPA: hypothetical protein VIC56_01310 [Gemmatimonadota bacterium]
MSAAGPDPAAAGERPGGTAGRQLDGSCPYCAGPLFKESWVLRCPRDHRFRATLRRADAAGGSPHDVLVLQVVAHPDRAEIGAQHAYDVPSAAAASPPVEIAPDGAPPGRGIDRVAP